MKASADARPRSEAPPLVAQPDDLPGRAPRANAATAASAAGVRALSAQAMAFYFRAPAKVFFRTRVDYLAYARTVHYQAEAARLLQAASRDHLPASKWSSLAQRAWVAMKGTTPGVLMSVIKLHGWGVVPHQILPPLMANVGVGAVLYTSYLQILGRFHEESAMAKRRVYPPPSPGQTFAAGFCAGTIQSFVAAPLDALQARYDHADLMPAQGGGRPRSLWTFGADKLREIGLRGIFAGWGLSLAKDSLGSALFFSTFEYLKAQSYYRFVTWYYGDLGLEKVDRLAAKRPASTKTAPEERPRPLIRPHYALEPAFLLLAGVSATFAQQLVLHPLTRLQVKHWDRLEDLDAQATRLSRTPSPRSGRGRRWKMLRAYYHAYRATWAACRAEAAARGQGLARWLYGGFWRDTVRQVPSTSAGLIIFELIRRKYGYEAEERTITRHRYDILLP